MLWPDLAQRRRIAEIRDNLIARISEAEREGWLGEIEGLKIRLAGADDKLARSGGEGGGFRAGSGEGGRGDRGRAGSRDPGRCPEIGTLVSRRAG